MNGYAIILVICSTFLHALWNLLARKRRAEAAFFHRALLFVLLMGIVPALAAEWFAGPFELLVYALAALSGVACGFYYFFLAWAYASSDFTVVYPVARALPVPAVGLADAVLGRLPSASGWLGMLMVVGGCLLAPLHSLGEFRLSRYFNRSILWMILAAAGTVCYSLIDKAAADLVTPGPLSAARYGYMFFITSLGCYTLLLRTFRRGKWECSDVGWLLPAIGGASTYLAYWLVLWAYQIARRAGYVVAFRQFSIVIGVVLALWLYRERGVLVRLTAACVITAGLLVIALSGG